LETIGAAALKAQPDFAVLFENFLAHAERLMCEFTGDDVSLAGAAGLDHGGLLVTFVNLRVA